MRIAIVCPVNELDVADYHDGDDISEILDAHMLENHKDWYKVGTLIYFPNSDAAKCPICGTGCLSARGADIHVKRSHKDYEKIDVMLYRKRKEQNGE